MAEATVCLWCLALFGVVAAVPAVGVVGAVALGAGVAAVAAGAPVAGCEPVVCAQAGTAASSEVVIKAVANFMARISVTGRRFPPPEFVEN
jgi:hypothetical protein